MAGASSPTAGDVFPYVLGDLVVILAAAHLVGHAFVRLRQPRVAGEIIAGILVGPTVLGGHVAALYPQPALAFLTLLGQIALVLYMFLVGLELNDAVLRGRYRQVVAIAVISAAASVAAGLSFGMLLDDSLWKPAGVSSVAFSIFLGASLTATAFPVTARILQERGLLNSRLGTIGVGASAAITVLTFLVIAAAVAAAEGAPVAKEVSLKALLVAALAAFTFLVVRPLLERVLQGRPSDKPPGSGVVALLLVGALASGLAMDRILGAGLLGGFLFGAAVPAGRELARGLISRLEGAVIIFLIPVFLAVSGLRTDLTLITGGLVDWIWIFLVAMLAGYLVLGYVAGRAAGLAGEEAAGLGTLLNCRGLLILVVGLIGLDAGLITPAMHGVFALVAVTTTLMTGPLLSRCTRATAAPGSAAAG